ncbi:MAG: M24 family metallopeptidase, partial [Planctomycetes bacterium]|nr:M24 family metallopeptidase [Planctomycetota bacterium]
MGQAILYCFRCSTQLREIQFEQGKAYKIDAWVCCAACAPEALKALPPDRAQALRKVIAGPEKKAPAAPQRDSNSRVSIAAAAAPPAAPGSPKWILIAGALLLGIGVLAAVALSGKPAVEPSVRAPAPEPAPLPPRPPPPPGAPADSPERQALRKAQQYAREHPDDLEGQLREFGDLTLLADKTDAGAEARKTMDSLQTRQRQIVEKGVAALDAELAAPLGRGDFAIALKTLEGARSRIAGALWKGAVEKRDREIRDRAIAALGPGVRLSTISATIEQCIKASGFDLVLQYVGHGIGQELHEEPQVPNFVSKELVNWDVVIQPGWVLAIEPMVTEGAGDTEELSDHWTVVT